MNLHKIGLKHGTDKSTYHEYMDFYEKHFDRKNIKRFLEIGVQSGASLKAWREWLPKDSVAEGWDINPSTPIDGCDIRIVDQLDVDQMLNNITGEYDVILDDGGHTAQMMQVSFSTLFKFSKLYVIEDLHAPWCGEHFLAPNDINTLDLLEGFNINGWISPYSTDEQKEYIDKNMEIVEIFVRGERSSPLSATAIIRNRSKDV